MKKKTISKMRYFASGATRDSVEDKLNFIKALSPIVDECYVAYLGRHRIMSDGSIRDWDNWKKGIPKQTFIESLDRHHRALWKLHQGFKASDNHGPVSIEDSLCGIIFNAYGYLYEILVNDVKNKKNRGRR